MSSKTFLILCLALLLPTPSKGETGASSALRLPRFASLRVSEANLRTGPGTRYPIEWVYRHEGLPLEITAEYDVWRRVKDWEGTQGWVHQSALSGRRMVIVTGEKPQDIKSTPSPEASLVATVDPGATGRALSCEATWCEVLFDRVQGYLPKSAFWGTYPNETW